jgi:RNAse (barnase) inhibitor barstar
VRSTPDYFGSNWDAFNDCFGDLSLPPRLAVVWRRADITGATSLKLLVEAVAIFQRTAEAVEPFGTQLVVAISGEGPGFARPSA